MVETLRPAGDEGMSSAHVPGPGILAEPGGEPTVLYPGNFGPMLYLGELRRVDSACGSNPPCVAPPVQVVDIPRKACTFVKPVCAGDGTHLRLIYNWTRRVHRIVGHLRVFLGYVPVKVGRAARVKRQKSSRGASGFTSSHRFPRGEWAAGRWGDVPKPNFG